VDTRSQEVCGISSNASPVTNPYETVICPLIRLSDLIGHKWKSVKMGRKCSKTSLDAVMNVRYVRKRVFDPSRQDTIFTAWAGRNAARLEPSESPRPFL
jgi:hypothetical protein